MTVMTDVTGGGGHCVPKGMVAPVMPSQLPPGLAAFGVGTTPVVLVVIQVLVFVR